MDLTAPFLALACDPTGQVPGLNFNLAVCLGAMTVAGSASSYSIPTVIGAILASLGIFKGAPALKKKTRGRFFC